MSFASAGETPGTVVKFLGPNGENAIEYMTGVKLSSKEKTKWDKDLSVSKYHTSLAANYSSIKEAGRKTMADELAFYEKLKWREGGKGGVLDVELLARVEAERKDIVETLSALQKKIQEIKPPVPFVESHKHFVAFIAHRLKDENARLTALSALLTGWRDKMGSNPAFPVKKMFDALHSDSKELKSAKESGAKWKAALAAETAKYFGRKPAKTNKIKPSSSKGHSPEGTEKKGK